MQKVHSPEVKIVQFDHKPIANSRIIQRLSKISMVSIASQLKLNYINLRKTKVPHQLDDKVSNGVREYLDTPQSTGCHTHWLY